MKKTNLTTTNKKNELGQGKVVTKNKRAQEEMVGFGLIVIIIAVILMIFLWFYVTKKPASNFQDYEAENYVQSILQYTSDCSEYGKERLDIQDLIYFCYDSNKECETGNKCEILKSNLDGLLEESFDPNSGGRIRGYSLNISIDNRSAYSKTEGNLSGNSRAYIEEYPKKGEWVRIVFSLYGEY